MPVRFIRRASDRHQILSFGRKRPTIPADVPTLKKFTLKDALPPPPVVRFDWATGSSALNKAGLENVLGNDRLGNCVEAACGHIIDIWHGDAGTGESVTEDQTVGLYSAAAGYAPDNPATDQGSDPVAVLDYLTKNPFAPGGQPIAGYVSIDPRNVADVKRGIWLFGGALIGGNLLSEWVADMPTMQNGFAWKAGSAPDLDAGHEVAAYGYNDNGIFINTWAMFGTLIWQALPQFAAPTAGGDVLVPLSHDWIAKATARAPSGYDFDALQAALATMGADGGRAGKAPAARPAAPPLLRADQAPPAPRPSP